ncbi:MAG: UDP-glucose/GDP-mannose dehydrogenase family protein [Deltaproteobacteria bacterium]|nr:UDP-glucose/GDP-mannose dehydrogenase family protein [Deltaproteobacteria bacterium]
MELTVVGTGYVGLVAGTCFAETGHSVVCVDKDAEKVARLRKGEIPIYEPRLEELVKRNVKKKRLSFSTELGENVGRADVVFIAVGTPQDEDGSADLSHVLDVAREIGAALTRPLVVVTKSTVPVGTGERIREAIASASDMHVDIVSNPEFLKEGSAVDDFMKPDRIIVGTDSDKAKAVMTDLYAPFNRTSSRILFMDVRSAEMTKYAANAMLATRISFMNEVANLCERVGADVNKVRQGIGSDPRIGPSFLFPGVGFGGSCFPKDIRALLRTSHEAGTPLAILRTVDEVNDRQKQLLLHKVTAAFGEDLRGKQLAVWGLAFKPQTDDMREAPAITIIEGLLARGARVRATDPEAMATARRIFGDRVLLDDDQYACLEGSDGLLVVTEWNEFRRPNFKRMRELLKQPYVFDGRNVYEPEAMRKMGFTYSCVGRPT